MNTISYFSYDTSSPSNLIWNNPNAEGKGKGERVHNTPAGSKSSIGWQVQVTENGHRYRSTVNKIVWELHHGPVPPRHKIMTRNNDKFDTRIENLICVPVSEVNFIKAWRTDAHGTTAQPSGSYFACIREDKQYRKIGTFKTFEEAKAEYRKELWKKVQKFYEGEAK